MVSLPAPLTAAPQRERAAARSARYAELQQWLLLLVLWLATAALSAYSLNRARDARLQAGFEHLQRQAQTVEQLLAHPLEGGPQAAASNPRHTAYFGTVLRAALHWPDASATLVRQDGTAVVGASMPATLLQQHLSAGQRTTLLQAPCGASGETCLTLLQTLAPEILPADGPRVLGIHRTRHAVLAAWQEQAAGIAIGVVLSGSAASVWLGLHQRRRRAQARAAHAADQAERDSARRLLVALEGADLGLWEWDLPSDTVRVNMREFEILGYPPQARPLAPEFWRGLLHPDERATLDKAVRAHLRGETSGNRIEHRMRHHDGHWVWVLDNARVMQHDARGRALRVVGTHLDISERKRTQIELERINGQLEALSLTDGLTGVANRRQFDLTLAAEWTRGLRQHQPVALLMIDIDHFKRYNDHLGHLEGDACLRAVAQRLSSCLRQPLEQLARYGGEEFAVLLTAADEDTGTRVAQRCLDAIASAGLAHPASPLGPRVTVSIGVASLQPDPAMAPEQLVHAADAALYRAKQCGRGRYAVATEADAQPRNTGMQPLQ